MTFRNPVIECDLYPFKILRKAEKEKYIWQIDVLQHIGGELTRTDYIASLDDDFTCVDEFKIAIVKTLFHFYYLSQKEAGTEGSECYKFKYLCQQVLFSHFIGYYLVENPEKEETKFIELLSDSKYLISCIYTMVTDKIKSEKSDICLSCERTVFNNGSDDYDIDIRIKRKKIIAYDYPFDSRKFAVLATGETGTSN